MPDQEMIERVVNILMKHNPQTRIGGTIVAYEIIKAMREPTEKMIEAFDEASPMYDDPNTTGEEYWTTAIDSILND